MIGTSWRTTLKGYLKAVVVSDDVWIGCGVRILSGVSIGSRSVVAAGAVVTTSVPGGVVVGGVPAKVLKRITKADM